MGSTPVRFTIRILNVITVIIFFFFFSGFRGDGWMQVDEFDSILRRAMSTLLKLMTNGYEGQDDGFAYTSYLLSLCQRLCSGCFICWRLGRWTAFTHFQKKKIISPPPC